MKVVIDTNIFISSFFGGKPKNIIDLWKEGKITICLSQDIIDEYVDVLIRLGISQKEIDLLLELFAEGHFCLYTHKTPKLSVVEKDPDDNKFFECAVKHKAKYIISGDKAVLEIKKYFQIAVLNAADFLNIFKT